MKTVLGRSHHDIRELLGLPPKAKLPVEGMNPRLIDGIMIWVTPFVKRGHKSSTHRVLAKCPCGAVLSAGRLNQHVCR